MQRAPRFGFVFPTEYRDYANRLFLALKNGIGAFKGVETTFRFPLTRDQVFQVSGFSIGTRNHHESATIYENAIVNWQAKQSQPAPDLFFVLHPRTPVSETDTPYYACKARLLTQGILSQNVTADLISDEAKFEWSAANIALGAFVKLGGVPWVVFGKEIDQELIVGVGRAFLFDPHSRATTGYVGFTACFSARGQFQFLSLADVAENRNEYLQLLKTVVATSLKKAEALGRTVSSLTLHVPKQMSREEMDVVTKAVEEHPKQNILQLVIIKVSEEDTFFAVDSRFNDGVPRRGTVVQVTDRDYLLYTEGREEKESWAPFRTPVALRITPQNGVRYSGIRTILRQVNDLSQVNWRGFNARSKPISIYYGSLIARLLGHVPSSNMKALSSTARQLLESRMWFV
ncbi:MAG TPA: Piwi domain-containing protein [Verrucomicrobiae bacterium]|nr:Piwi domain-containing protein [Verrucomicrobiae bacterium]